jgi:flagellar hook-associated protein 2
MKIDVSGDAAIGSLLSYDPEGTQNLGQTQAAQNALLTVDGVPITSEDNTVTDAIQGVTLTLAKITTGAPPLTVTVSRDTTALTQTVSSLVSSYNALNSALAGTTGKGAPLQGNIGALSLQRQVRTILTDPQVPGAALSVLSQLGVSFQKDGSLKFDATVLSKVAATNPNGVAALVAATGTKLGEAATALLGTTGPLQSGTDGINRSIKDLDSRRVGIQRRIDATEVRLRAQFSALDLAMSGMQRTSAFLTQQLANLPSTSN